MHSTSVASGQPMHLAHAAKRPGSSAPAAWKTEAGMHAWNRASSGRTAALAATSASSMARRCAR
eukprot:1079130-Prymnesium_polylepis.1